MKEIKVSVIMTVYNGEEYLYESINSILNQSYTNLEFLILNDGSTDSTSKILKTFDNPKIRIFDLGKLGRSRGLNYLISHSQGEYIANIDADDLSKADRIQKQVEYLDKHPEAILIATGSELIDSKGKIIGESEWDKVVVVNNLLGKYCPINHSSVMYRKYAIEKVGGYNVELNMQVDYELWIRLAKFGELHVMPSKLVQKRLHAKQKYEKSGYKYQINALKIQKKAITNLNLSKWNYLYVFLRYIYYTLRINRMLNRNIISKIQKIVIKEDR